MKKFKKFLKFTIIRLFYYLGGIVLNFFRTWAVFDKIHVATRNQIRRGNAVKLGPQYWGLKK